MAGNIQVMFQLITGISGQVKGAKVKPIAVLSDKRSSVLPDVPTTAEAGMPGLESGTWFGLLAPKGTPKPVIARMNAEVNKLLQTPEFRQKVMSMGLEPLGGTPEQFAKYLDDEIRRWAEIVKISGAKID
jgi:tripartite-type tricarboxylate transporter receptor subunit TctC